MPRERPRPQANLDTLAERYRRLWEDDRWLLDTVWDKLPEGSDLRTKIGGGFDEALEKAWLAERRLRELAGRFAELGDRPEDLQQLLDLGEKVGLARTEFEAQLDRASRYLAEITFQLVTREVLGAIPDFGTPSGRPVPRAERRSD